jgi:hypothetical protein
MAAKHRTRTAVEHVDFPFGMVDGSLTRQCAFEEEMDGLAIESKKGHFFARRATKIISRPPHP